MVGVQSWVGEIACAVGGSSLLAGTNMTLGASRP